jgi:hypothetical protein
MIIVEGPDLAGKTRFCQDLQKHLGKRWQYRHLSRPGHDFPGYDTLMGNFVICDRFHISAPLYGLARGENPALSLTPAEYRRVQGKLMLRASVTVVLLPCAHAIAERWRVGEMYDLSTVLKARYWYRQFCSGALPAYPPAVDFLIDTTTFDGIDAYFKQIADLYYSRV